MTLEAVPPRRKRRRGLFGRYRRARAFVRYYVVGTATRSGRLVDVFIVLLITTGVGALILESVPEYRARFGRELLFVEAVVGIAFIIEYLARLWVAPRKLRYVVSFWGIVDLLAILPFLFRGFDLAYLRLFRLLRIFSILKVAEYTSASRLLLESIVASRSKIGVFLFTVLVLLLVLGFTMHATEPQTFPTVPHALWWTIVTLTTTGYGDFVPQTPLGKLIAGAAMLVAFGIIAVPTGIVVAEYNLARQGGAFRCPGCGRRGHDDDARYCARCGLLLPVPPEERARGGAVRKA